MWTGLENTLGASNGGLAQGGTVGDIFCINSGCAYRYYAAYEFLPNTAVQCFNLGFQNDNIVSDVLNHVAIGGDVNHYDVIVSDLTNGQACSATNQSYSVGGDGPFYGVFIDERPTIQPPPPNPLPYMATLPQFTTANMPGTNTITICTPQCSQQNIRDSFIGGLYRYDGMIYSGGYNIQLGTDTSCGNCGIIDQQWKTSAGT